uniref:Uncharacterized protein n=1 Tax=Anguilla anguilla TaxID=7936 RepID=A0A0E9PD09_ANGAN
MYIFPYILDFAFSHILTYVTFSRGQTELQKPRLQEMVVTL